jgi:RecB family exonuclease
MIAANTLATEKPQSAQIDHLSWSSLQSFKACPRRFFYRYVERAPEESRAATLAFGSAIHRAIELVQEARITGQALPKIDELMADYESGWSESAEAGTPVSFAAGEDAQTLREKARQILETYLGHAQAETGEVIGIEHEARVRIVPNAPPLLTRIDLIERIGDELVLTDFKTGRAIWNPMKTAESLPQLILYGQAVQPIARALGVRRIVTRFVVLTKSKTPKIQVLTPRPTEGDVAKLKDFVGDTWASISSGGGFPRCESWQCKQCPFAKRCLGLSSNSKL